MKLTDLGSSRHPILIYILAALLAVVIFAKLEYKIRLLSTQAESSSALASEYAKENQQLNDELKRADMKADAYSRNTDIEESVYEVMSESYPSDLLPEFDRQSCVNAKNTSVNEDIADKNDKYMNNIQNYGKNVAAEYISQDKDRELCFTVMSEIKSLSDEICEGASSDSDKAKLIAVWEAKNICYDYDAAETGVDGKVISLAETLSLRRTTCAGYSNLFAALCQAQGIICVNLGGGAVNSAEYTVETVPYNHEWNAAYCDGQWLFYDVTWAANGEYHDGDYTYIDTVDEIYIGMDFYEMTGERRIDKSDYRNFYSALFEYFK